VLNRLRSGPPANLLENRLAAGAVGAVHSNLDQLVALQSAVDFREDRGREPGLADPHHRIEPVRPRFQLASPGG